MARNEIARALLETLISPNEHDSNFEPANVVDALFAIARAIEHLAEAINMNGKEGVRTWPETG